MTREGLMFKVGAELLTPTAFSDVFRSQLRACFCPRCRRHYQGVPTPMRREPRVLHIPCTDCKHKVAYRVIDIEVDE